MMTTTQVQNRFFICLREFPLSPVPWMLSETLQNMPCDCLYFGKVFKFMEKHLTTDGLIFYLTWDTEQLPSYGENVVAVILGDEFSYVPRYAHKVRAIFKTLSMRPIIGSNFLLNPSYLNLMMLLQVLRVWITRTPSLLYSWLQQLKGNSIAPIYDVPLGYYNQSDLPIKPILERRYDLFFAGSLVTAPYPIWSRRRWLRNPKDIARQEMVSAIEDLQTKHPELKIVVCKTNDFGLEANFPEDTRSYSERLMDSKICLAPRGSLFETFRFFEGLRYGCIVVTEALPPRWFYKDSPVIQLSVWSDLERMTQDLSKKAHILQLKHEASLNYWKAKCSEESIGKFMAEKITSRGDRN